MGRAILWEVRPFTYREEKGRINGKERREGREKGDKDKPIGTKKIGGGLAREKGKGERKKRK